MRRAFPAARVLAATVCAALRAVAGAAAAPGTDADVDPEVAALSAEARAAAKALGGALKARLMETIAAEGPVAAIDVCHLEAPGIAGAVSADLGLDVGRTALRLRNPANAPADDWERATLAGFAAAIGSGGVDPASPEPASLDPASLDPFSLDPFSLETAEIVVADDGAREFRWMTPILTEGPCLLCHGEALAPEVAAAIAARYPDDAATGFAEGSVRGAFVVRKRLAD